MGISDTQQPAAAGSVTSERYMRTAAEGMLDSLHYYGWQQPSVAGEMGTPAWYANQLRKVLYVRGDQLPGAATDWWGDRWARYAHHLLDQIGADPARHTCAMCLTVSVIGEYVSDDGEREWWCAGCYEAEAERSKR